MLSSGQTSAQFVGPYPFDGSQAKELGADDINIKQEAKSNTAVNGWGGQFYPHGGCPHCGYCPTCGRSNGYPKPYWEWQPWNQPYYMSSHYTGSLAQATSGHTCAHVQ